MSGVGGAESARMRLAEPMAALSLITDLAMGKPTEIAIRALHRRRLSYRAIGVKYNRATTGLLHDTPLLDRLHFDIARNGRAVR